MAATMKCPECGEQNTGEPAVSAGFSGVAPGGALPRPSPVGYRFECKKCGHVWYPTVDEVDVK